MKFVSSLFIRLVDWKEVGYRLYRLRNEKMLIENTPVTHSCVAGVKLSRKGINNPYFQFLIAPFR